MGSKTAVSEIVGVMLLIGISVTLFSIVYYSILSTQLREDAPDLLVIGQLDEQSNILIHHQGGQSIDGNNQLQIELAGIRQPMKYVKNCIIKDENYDSNWDFGESILYPTNNASNLEIRANIYDQNSNSLVLSALLQEGYAISPYGLGGIWHLDEGIGPIAYDSSGNKNHGRIFGANWNSGINNSALSFNPFDNDYVLVQDRISLDISSAITIEAWFNPYNINNIINKTSFSADFGYHPHITHVNDAIYAVVYRRGPNPNSDCILKTLEIEPNGNIDNISVDEFIVDVTCTEPKIVKITNELIAVAYGDENGKCHLKTFFINDLGNITYSTNEFITGDYCYELSFIPVVGDIYAIVYGNVQKGYFFTINITSTGQIGSEISSYNFNQRCEDPDLIQFGNALFILSYLGNNRDYLKSFTIDEGGSIIETGYSLEFFDGSDDPDLVRISENTLAITFEDDKKRGILKTYEVAQDGLLNDTGYSIIFEYDTCHDPDIIKMYNDIYAIVYEGPVGHIGKLAKIEILPDGEIESIQSIKEYDSQKGFEPHIIQISEHVFIIVYREETPHPGGISTISYVADIINPAYKAGIYKNEAFGIYCNYTTAFGFLNNRTISYSGINPGWIHLAMVYDQYTIKLYINGTEVISAPYVSNEIRITDDPFIIGKAFYGIIDEIAVYGNALTVDQVFAHYANPGSLYE
jgi:hypothetical protein